MGGRNCGEVGVARGWVEDYCGVGGHNCGEVGVARGWVEDTVEWVVTTVVRWV